MIRFRSIELINVKNVAEGKIDLKDCPSGASILGIYGQNGSGKTAIIEAIDCIQDMMTGAPLSPDCVDLIGSSGSQATIKAEFQITEGSETSLGFVHGLGDTAADGKPYSAYYEFSFDDSDGRPRIAFEKLAISAEGITKRTLISYDNSNDSELDELKPSRQWGSLRALAGKDASFNLAVAQRSNDLQSASKLFSDTMTAFALAARNAYKVGMKSKTLPSARRNAYETVLLPFMDTKSLLYGFASAKLIIIKTRRSAALAYNLLSLSAPDTHRDSWLSSKESKGILLDILLPIDQTAVLPVDSFNDIRPALSTINQVLKSIVPGLTVVMNVLNDESMDDGTPGKRIELLSCRDDVRVPFRTESEGIKKIVSMLGWLINVYNDDSACLAVDEIDSGVFEFLLGELLQVIAEHGSGQLIFTAHNLRALECLPVGCLVFTTTNPNRRYIKFRGSAPSNNLRNQYLRSINLGGQKEQVYAPTNSVAINNAFLSTCSPETLDLDSLVASISGEH